MSHWDIYKMPLYVRKWYVRKLQKRLTKQTSPTEKPLTNTEKKKFIEQNKQFSNEPGKMTNLFQPMKK
jgi:hypothetical protein